MVEGLEEGAKFCQCVAEPACDGVDGDGLDFRDGIEGESFEEMQARDGCLFVGNLGERRCEGEREICDVGF